jgi:hypothetical protein
MMSDTAVERETPPASRWEDYIDVFFSPAELFARRAGDRVGPPLITLLVLGLLVYVAMLPANAMIMRAALADNPEQAAALERMGPVVQVFGGITVLISYLVMIAVAGFLLWAVGRLAEIRTEMSRTLLIATYASFVYLVSQVAASVAIMLHGEVGLDVLRHSSFGPLRFMSGEMNPVLMALVRRLDIFIIWQAVLWGVGLMVIYRASRAQAAITAAAAWILFAIPTIIAAALGFGPNTGG